ncbi:CBN-GEN-1 protein [Caenorhabditis brenneri]|uniref:CBN-GEN-1 protein n=1 Tax=Caenorhabditis brenneri TaxID=135651 RepID=G0N2S2_CAEBE|nr:CBN-GEN-1 protein [Caenorhabditis brenneri]
MTINGIWEWANHVSQKVSLETLRGKVLSIEIARPHLISTAILLGCDYFQRGVQGIGLVTVFDILAEFGDDGSEDVDPHVILDRFASYVREEIPARSEDTPRKLRLRRKTYSFQPDFPNCDAVQTAIKMYMNPKVLDDEQLVKGRRDQLIHKPLEVERVLSHYCGWKHDRLQKEFDLSARRSRNIDSIVSQTRIPEFFASTRFTPLVEPCKSVNEYITASSSHVRKRKRPDSSSGHQKGTQKRVMLPVDTGRRRTNNMIASQRQAYSNGIIELDSD